MHEMTNEVTYLRSQLEEQERVRIQVSDERERLIIDLHGWEMWNAEHAAPLQEEARQAVTEIAALREASQQSSIQSGSTDPTLARGGDRA